MNIDHRNYARDMDLFHFQDDCPGLIFWHPQGWKIFREIENYMRSVHKAHGYQETRTPTIVSRHLWEVSGHWDKFQENMFITGDTIEAQDENMTVEARYALRPMSCPSHVQIYRSTNRSYRELPFRVMEFGRVFRNEPSGSLSGIMRLREFTQDDAHIFCRRNQIMSEATNYVEMLRETYRRFGYDEFTVKLSTRPEKRAGIDEDWDYTEGKLAEALEELNIPFEIFEGEGAFYGPKLEFTLKDALGRDWQCGTFQLDIVLPKRFDLSFIREEGDGETPVIIHHAVLGSIERWIGVLLEHHQGNLPLWLSPSPVALCTVSEKVNDKAYEISEKINKRLPDNCHVIIDDQADKITAKIKRHSVARVPVISVLGEREVENKEVNIRILGEKKTFNMSQFSFISAMRRIIRNGGKAGDLRKYLKT